ncbi:hypothetical protein [Marispirochaeta aestuarii]|uniref:capsular polysaccharide export protein, LipB/KpsS family n=1 Tax=Marispirochaeta aestuarii TaxID=1963862 RepID=UPI0029C6E839|nr:hypothetical protein [Marispirochaeta aestuarii]
MNTIYAVSRLKEWKDVSIKLKKNFCINPVYWICSKEFKNEIMSVHQDVYYHETVDANRGVFLEQIEQKNFLSKKMILECAHIEREFYTMINRHDLDGSFTYEDRKRLYYLQLNYWINVIKRLDIKLLILSETPHSLSHYIIYMLCKKMGIPTLMLSYTTIPGTLYAKESIESVPHIPIKSNNKEYLDKILNRNVDKLSSDNEKPWYMLKQERLFFRAGVVIWLQALVYIIPYLLEKLYLKKRKIYSQFYKKKGKLFESSDYTRGEFVIKRIDLRRRQKKLKKAYRSISIEPDLNKKYIYFPLHFQPERSSCPEGSVYTDQQILIQMIADRLPPDTYLYVKEHPSQYMMTRGPLGRRPSFYTDIRTISKVILVDDFISSNLLIKNSIAVVTLTGTAGLEALLRGKPALVFGYAWYRHLPGTYYIQGPEDLDSALEHILSSPAISIDQVRQMINNQNEFLFAGYLMDADRETIDIDYQEHVDTLYKGYASLLAFIGIEDNSHCK